MQNITGVVVSYNTKDLLQTSIDSIRKFYPDMPLIIIDGSKKTDPCYQYVKSLKGNTTCIFVDYNIGHGRGMHLGIETATTPYILVFDSDIRVNKEVLSSMMKAMKDDTYAVGSYENVCKDGYFHKGNTSAHRIPYLHPFFLLINREQYFKFQPFKHHGSPCIHAMNDIYNQRLSESILVEFPVKNYVTHFWRGTRAKFMKEFLVDWERPVSFIDVITRRHPHRNSYFKQNRDSLLQQTDRDFDHRCLVDTKGIGVPGANAALAANLENITGKYVFILDDDDVFTDNDFVKDMKQIAEQHDPDVIMVKMLIRDKVYPTEEVWEKAPKFAHIGMSNFVVKNAVYQKHAHKFKVPRGADFSFIEEVFKQKYKIYWQDKIYSKTLVVSRGKPEPSHIPIISAGNNEKITVITCTGDRPQAFNLCKTWLNKQTVQPDQWIVVDDGKQPMNLTDCDYIYRKQEASDPKHTLSVNLLHALPKVTGDKIIFFEDDDWYHSSYIEEMSTLLNTYSLVGIKNLIFYHIGLTGFNNRVSVKRPPLFQTALRKEVIPHLKQVCQLCRSDKGISEKGLIDLKLWDSAKVENKSIAITTEDMETIVGKIKKGRTFHQPFPKFIQRRIGKGIGVVYTQKDMAKYYHNVPSPISIGMKGMPGRAGLTQAQKGLQKFYTYDKDCTYLQKILADDFKYYKEFIK